MRYSKTIRRTTWTLAALVVLSAGGCMLFQPAVHVDFEASPASGMTPHLVDFVPLVDGDPVAYVWEFGDGVTSEDPAPSHIYRTAGTFTVRLTVRLANGDTADVVKEDLIEVALRAGKAPASGPLVWLDRGAKTIYAGPRAGGEVTTVASVVGYQKIQHIAVADGKVYWTTEGRIERCNLDGSERQTLRDRSSGLIGGIAVDAAAGRLYWTEGPVYSQKTAKIWRANLNGSGAEAWAGAEDWDYNNYIPSLLAVDAALGRLYWTEKYITSGSMPASAPRSEEGRSIHWSAVASFADRVAFAPTPQISGIALDVGLPAGSRHVYWAERANNQISVGTHDIGTSSRGLMTAAAGPMGVAADAAEGRIYWSDSDGIHRANLWDGSEVETVYAGVRADALAISF